jgi:hypothetical protein
MEYAILALCIIAGIAISVPIIRAMRRHQIKNQRAMRRASADIARERMGCRLYRDGRP